MRCPAPFADPKCPQMPRTDLRILPPLSAPPCPAASAAHRPPEPLYRPVLPASLLFPFPEALPDSARTHFSSRFPWPYHTRFSPDYRPSALYPGYPAVFFQIPDILSAAADKLSEPLWPPPERWRWPGPPPGSARPLSFAGWRPAGRRHTAATRPPGLPAFAHWLWLQTVSPKLPQTD